MSDVVKIVKNNNFTVMSNKHLRDNHLSLKAKGLLSLVLSLPDDWDYTIKGLQTFATDGRDSFRSSLSELEKYGYLYRSGARKRNKTGQLGNYEYTFFENPEENEFYNTETKGQINKNTPKTYMKSENKALEPASDFPTQGKPTQGKPTQENPTQLNKEILNTEKLNTDNIYNQSYLIKDNIDSKVVSDNDKIDKIELQKSIKAVCKQIDADYLLAVKDNQKGCYSPELIKEIIELIAWINVAPQKTVKINKVNVDIHLVREKFLQLESRHIRYVLDCIISNTQQIKQRRTYILTCLYNAPTTIDGFYANANKSVRNNSNSSYDLEEWEKFAMTFDPMRINEVKE